uniref:Aminotransferase-like plant mobile domain-containing protein n=1 Tax=Ananas comosus var. bracteatus TaxID=296719 RepID=A0A6V7QM53_ANACO|nr:unnamed protein product [Ananas comosus var. bracteatus]
MANNPDDVTDFEAHLDLAYTKFICRLASQSHTPVTRKEHTAFLLYWLYYNLFCTRSQKINQDFVPIAVALANGERLVLGQPLNFSHYFKVFYERASSGANEYADVWFSILATRDLHVGLKNYPKLTPSTEVYSPHYVARQFGFVQRLPAPAKFFTANIAHGRPPYKGCSRGRSYFSSGKPSSTVFQTSDASASASLPVYKPIDPLAISLQDLAASSPKSNEKEELSTTTSAETQKKLGECLRVYSSGLPTLA